MTTLLEPPVNSSTLVVPQMIELEITGKCQLECDHCYADSGPSGTHGTMTLDDWRAVVSEAAELGVQTIQLIGGEPTTYPGWRDLVDHILTEGLQVEVFTNLFHVTDKGWETFSQKGVTVATSYYSVNAGHHDRVTKTPGSHARTRANIEEAVRRQIPVRAGVVGCHDGQLEQLAVQELYALGVGKVSLDYARGVGRAALERPNVGVLCGNCGRGRLAIMPDGSVSPCVLGRFLRTGHVKEEGGLRTILASPAWRATVASIPPRKAEPCAPDGCNPTHGSNPGQVTMGMCPPSDSNDCNPATTPACNPAYG